MKEYMLKRYHERMDLARTKLGSVCCRCGGSENLQIDHKDPAAKSFTVAKCWSFALERFNQELEKCQLLCNNCHQKKTCQDNNKVFVKDQDTHGTLSSFRYCKCALCKKAKADYMKAWNQRKRDRGREAHALDF